MTALRPAARRGETGAAGGSAIEVRDLFRVHRTSEGDAAALQGLTLTVADGEVLAVLGPSGSGKTSLLRVLSGLDPPSAGTARVLGHDLGRLPARRRAAFRQAALGLIDQHYDRALPAALPARDVVALPLALRGEPRRAARARAERLLARVGLGERGDARPAELSGGERQRVAVCTALAARPRLLLADEPAGELDDANATLVYRLIAELAREEGATAVLVSHDPAARAIADRTVRLRDGRVADEAGAGAAAAGALVVGRGGWLRLPEELLREAGLGDRLHARAEPGAIVLAAAGAGAPPGPPRRPELRGPRPAAAARGVEAELREVDKAFGTGRRTRHVLRGFSAAFPAGRLSALTGRSGSGKSTVLALLAGLERPDAGGVLVGGRPVAGDRAARARLRRERIAVVMQDLGLVDHLTAEENVALGLALAGAQDGTAPAEADAWLAEVGLAERTRQRVHRLSAGERQRVAIARALATRRPLLLVDEPTSRLDEANAAAVGELLAAAARDHGVTVVCATHEPLLVRVADAQVTL